MRSGSAVPCRTVSDLDMGQTQNWSKNQKTKNIHKLSNSVNIIMVKFGDVSFRPDKKKLVPTQPQSLYPRSASFRSGPILADQSSGRVQNIKFVPKWVENRRFGPKQRPNESYGLSGPIRTTPEAKNGQKAHFCQGKRPRRTPAAPLTPIGAGRGLRILNCSL